MFENVSLINLFEVEVLIKNFTISAKSFVQSLVKSAENVSDITEF